MPVANVVEIIPNVILSGAIAQSKNLAEITLKIHISKCVAIVAKFFRKRQDDKVGASFEILRLRSG